MAMAPTKIFLPLKYIFNYLIQKKKIIRYVHLSIPGCIGQWNLKREKNKWLFSWFIVKAHFVNTGYGDPISRWKQRLLLPNICVFCAPELIRDTTKKIPGKKSVVVSKSRPVFYTPFFHGWLPSAIRHYLRDLQPDRPFRIDFYGPQHGRRHVARTCRTRICIWFSMKHDARHLKCLGNDRCLI